MRIAVLADIHGNIEALESAWRSITLESPDITVCLGDLVHFGPDPDECVSFIREHSVDCVQGNCDRAAARGRRTTGDEFINSHWERLAEGVLAWTVEKLSRTNSSWLRGLPGEFRIEADGAKMLLTHGLPGNVAGSLPENAADEVFDLMLSRNACNILVVGHTHRQSLVCRPGGRILNPGSVGGGTLPSAASAMIIEISRQRGFSACWLRAPFDFDSYRKSSRKAGIPEVFTRAVELGRDPRGAWHTTDIRWRQRWAEQ